MLSASAAAHASPHTRLGNRCDRSYPASPVNGDQQVTFAELTNVRDVTLSLESGEADVTTRANSGWRATVATLKEASVEFEMVWDTEDAGFTRQKEIPFTWGRGGVRAAV